VVSVNSYNHLTCSNITNVVFSKTLNYCVLPTTYVKNQSLPFAVFNSGAGNITVKAYANGGNPVWSQAYSGNNISGSIPADITNQHEFDYISFENNSLQSLATKVTDPEVTSLSDVRALIILPDRGIRFRDYRTIADVKKAFKNRGVVYEVLWGPSATYYNVAFRRWVGINIKYMFIDAHGSYRLQKLLDDTWVLRTVIQLYDCPVVSMKQSDFPPGQAPSWCEHLEGWEYVTKSFYSMGYTTLEFVYSNSCWGGHLKINSNNELVEAEPGEAYDFDAPQSDMSIALGMDEPSKSRFYRGWNNEYLTNALWDTEFQEWARLEWQFLGEGENLYWALYYTIMQQTEFGPDDPVNNYILRGQGSMMDIQLRSW